jgi:uncharacterized protein (DUF1697 family)
VKTFVALLRGLNVGGTGRVSMSELTRLFEQCGCAGVRTYIQSGNVVFQSDAANPARLATELTAAVLRRRGFAPRVILLTRVQLERAVAANPYPEAANDPARLHLFFLSKRPRKPDLKALNALEGGTERFALEGAVFYLHAPDGIGRSKLAQNAERLLGVDATARNWRTVTALVEMARAR